MNDCLKLFVSVVIPTRDRFDLVLDALKGLAQQTLDQERYEVIVVDNGSADNTYERLIERQHSFPFSLKVVRSPVSDKGPAPARNFGVQSARGDVIAFTDSDCRPANEWLEKGLEAFSDSAIDLVTGIVDFKPEQLDELGFFSRKTVVSSFEHPTYPTANAFYRKSTFLKHSGFDVSLSFPNILGQAVEAADTDLAWRIKEAGSKNLFVSEAIVFHEVQVVTPREWMMEPLRLFLVPALVKTHPGMRAALLKYNLFFYAGSIIYYLLFFIMLVLLVVYPAILLGVPVLIVLAAILKTRSLKPKDIGGSVVRMLLNAMRIYVMSATLIYGSIRFRSLVL